MSLLSPPWENSRDVIWYSVHQFADRHRRSPSTVRMWCRTGRLIRRGCRVYRDPEMRWWIGESHSNNAHNATHPSNLLTI